jgi:prophage regulatory protein
MEASLVTNSADRIIRLRTVLDRTGLSRSTVYRKIAEGTFPSQVRISIHGAGWRESAINRWIEDPVGYREEITDRVAQTQKAEEGAR